MDCTKVKELLYSFLDRELDENTVRLIEEHLDICPLCATEVDKEKRWDCLLREHLKKEEAPPQFRDKILGELKRRASGVSRLRLYTWLFFAALAVCILLFTAANIIGIAPP